MRQRVMGQKKRLERKLDPKNNLPPIAPKRPIALLISYTLFVSSVVLLLMIGAVWLVPQTSDDVVNTEPANKQPLRISKVVSERKQPSPASKPDNSTPIAAASANIFPDAGSSSSKIAYLTFDDGPNPVYTPLILEILKLNRIKATFFIVGKKAESEPEIVKAIASGGHMIGNHTYEHDYDVVRSWPTLEESVNRTQNAIESICGIRPTLFRPPGGTTFVGKESRDRIGQLGFRIVLWDITTGDGSMQTTPEQMINLVNTQLSTKYDSLSVIILMHDDRPASVIALQQIITLLADDGYTFSTIE